MAQRYPRVKSDRFIRLFTLKPCLRQKLQLLMRHHPKQLLGHVTCQNGVGYVPISKTHHLDGVCENHLCGGLRVVSKQVKVEILNEIRTFIKPILIDLLVNNSMNIIFMINVKLMILIETKHDTTKQVQPWDSIAFG